MNRPYVICHMVISIDGKVTGRFLWQTETENGTEEYYRINRGYDADAYACGRITMNESFAKDFVPDLTPFKNERIARNDYIADKEAAFFAVAFDRRGKLGWQSSRISDEDEGYDNAHIIEVLCEDVKDSYLAYLRSIGVSYVFAGTTEMHIETALEKLYELFGIKKLLLEGGSEINGAFARENVIDELSLVTVPVIADKNSKPLFDASILQTYRLSEVKQLSGCVYQKYVKQ